MWFPPVKATSATLFGQVADLKAGDYFGENALLRDEPRNATIKANSQALAQMPLRVSWSIV